MGRCSQSLKFFISGDKKHEKGETLVSVFLGAVLVMFVIGASMAATNRMMNGNQVSSESPSICRDVATNVLNVIRSNGIQSKVFEVPIDSSSVRLNDSEWQNGKVEYNPKGVIKEFGVSNAYYRSRWPNVKVVNWSGDRNHVSHGPRLIHGAINALLSIYNTSPAVCSNEKGLRITGSQNLASLAPPQVVDNHRIETHLRIRPYNLTNGSLLACNRNLRIRPYAQVEPPHAEQFNILDLSNYRADRGLEVEVFVSATPLDQTNQRGKNQAVDKTFNCSYKNRFQYEQADTQPFAPNIDINGGTVTVEFPKNSSGDYINSPGSQLICRESHFQHNPNQLAAARSTHSRRGTANLLLPDSGGWVPCDLMQICNRRPNRVRIDEKHKSMTLNYSIPNYCMVSVQARTVDVNGNISGIDNSSSYNGNSYNPPDPSDDRGPAGGYSVGGVNFESLSAARQAADLSGLSIVSVTNVPPNAQVNDQNVDSMYDTANNSIGQLDSAIAGANTATNALNGAGGTSAAANSATSSSAAGAAASALEASAGVANGGVAQAQAAATAAANNLASVRASAETLARNNGLVDTAPISGPAIHQAEALAQKAAEELEKAKAAAAELARLAAEARRREAELREQERRERERRERERDDDDGL